MSQFKSGFIAIMGRPNVGKSTLMNQLVGEKVAIISHKPQTTRHQIRGILNGDDYQMVFIDTPGLHKPKSRLGEFMVKSALSALEEVDAAIVVVDASEEIGTGDRAAIESLKDTKTPVVLVLNKIDKIEKNQLLALIDGFQGIPYIREIIPMSALKGDGAEDLLKVLESFLEEGPKYFPEDMYTDQPERVIVAEMIREKTLHLLRDEIPHGIGVEILSMEQIREDMVEIHANLMCERQSHKPIIIGKRGSMLKEIGTKSRHDMEKLLGSRINLQLWVKVVPDWRNKTAIMRDLGYHEG